VTIPLGFLVLIVVSLLTRPGRPEAETQRGFEVVGTAR
jgi:hypothetical protein